MVLLLKDLRKCMICYEVCVDKDVFVMYVMFYYINGLFVFLI